MAAAVIPADDLRVSGIHVLAKRVQVRIETLLDEAGRASATAVRGSPAQHERDFYRAFGIRAGDPAWLDSKRRVAIW